MRIAINKSDIKIYGKTMKDYSADFGDEIKEFNAIIDSINSIWSGNDALKYINTMRESYLTRLNKLKEDLDNYGEYLERIPDVYSKLDEVFTSKKIEM